ncbi:MAG: glucosaminidase domain-containing protein [Bacteroidaceae bacterium]|nr:glucosaminidase domain-containing protein [Bacteroidaceae bacterium]
MNSKRYRILLLVLFAVLTAWPQGSTNHAYWAYIDRYKDLAMEQQQRYKIPASITLAQGLLESSAGRSRLATEANNHFGIKTPGGWTGPYILANDDLPNEKFRKYRSARESYEDHSLFLMKPRYRCLFTYRITDYKSWAHGLKACGYATNPAYAQSLIRIIEMYSLHQFDTRKSGHHTTSDTHVNAASSPTAPATVCETPCQSERISRAYLKRLARNKIREDRIPAFFRSHAVYYNNDNFFIVVQAGDNMATISKSTGIGIGQLLDYNDLTLDYTLTIGDILYLRKKRKNASAEYKNKPHLVQPGQSMHDISQMYGIRLKNLYRLNNLSPREYQVHVGDLIWLR